MLDLLPSTSDIPLPGPPLKKILVLAYQDSLLARTVHSVGAPSAKPTFPSDPGVTVDCMFTHVETVSSSVVTAVSSLIINVSSMSNAVPSVFPVEISSVLADFSPVFSADASSSSSVTRISSSPFYKAFIFLSSPFLCHGCHISHLSS